MAQKILIEVDSVMVLELICLLNVLDLREDAAPRFKRYQKCLEDELTKHSTIEELVTTTEQAGDLLDENFFAEIIE